MPLTDTQIKVIKPEAKARKLADEKGLYVRRLHAANDGVVDLKARLDVAERERSALDKQIFRNQPTHITLGAYKTAGSWPPEGPAASVSSMVLQGSLV
jgi:hypothetical protein